jgi:hypothetical protein
MSKAKANERREKLDAMRREQQAADRKRNLLFGGIGGVLALAIIGGSVFAVQRTEANKPENKELASFGVSAADAACTDVIEDKPKSEDINNHVPPVDAQGNVTVVSYETTPPSYGPHFGAPAPFEREFYTDRDRPAMEELVHNLEHGYVVVWYDPSLPAEQIDDLRGVVANLRANQETQKIIASAWDPAYGTFDDDAKVAMSHWGRENSARQLCGAVSGEVIGAFANEHPPTESPEPFGA